MLSKRLETAFKLTDEEKALVFERFVNAFLLPDYPELQAIGGKKDKGIDARIWCAESGENELIVQSCVSPRTRARTKILDTIKKLEGNMPHTFVYCTTAVIGLDLDETRRELRRQHKVGLEVCDGAWFAQRAASTEDRAKLSEAFAVEILNPVIAQVAPERLYSAVLSENEERLATQYLEAHSIDRTRGRNLTKALYDALIIFVLRDSDPKEKLITKDGIIGSICAMFPAGHHQRIREIVPPRLERLVSKKMVNYHAKEARYVLSHSNHEKLERQLRALEDREVSFRACLREAIAAAIEDNEIDYEYDMDSLIQFGHNCLLWYLREQGKQLQDPVRNLVNIMNTEELVAQYLHSVEDNASAPEANGAAVMDILPPAIFKVISSKDPETRSYLRSKSDVFVVQAFLQSTPDVQKVCRKLFGHDVVYVGTTILIHCAAELYGEGTSRRLMGTLETASRLGVKIKTFRPFVQEFVAHLQGPVLLEYLNHFQSQGPAEREARLQVAPRLISVFAQYAAAYGGSVESVVHDIIGSTNCVENAVEFIKEEFGIQTEAIPELESPVDHEEWQGTFGKWLASKRRSTRMSEDRFELLVRNDVNAYTAIRILRRKTKIEGENYGHKIWFLTLDRMYWKIPSLLGKHDDFSYHVGMSLDFLVNFVATLANMDANIHDDFTLPGTLITDQNAFIPAELRDIAATEWQKPNMRRYMKRRKIRQLIHETRTTWEGPDEAEDASHEFEDDARS